MKYRLSITPALEVSKKTIVHRYETAEQMMVSKDIAANLLVFIQDELKVMKDFSNMFVMEEFINGKWEEYEEW
jgi:hypothetical protein